MLTAIILAAAMQVGPNPSIQPAPAIPEELRELRELQRQKEARARVTIESDPLLNCLSRAEEDSTAAVVEANDWLSRAAGIDRAKALHCRAVAQTEMGRFQDAALSFVEADKAASPEDMKYRARLGAMAGAAFLAAQEPMLAVGALDVARDQSQAAGFAALTGEIELDRARAFVAMGDMTQAEAALAAARQATPLNARAWLLSATLARRGVDMSAAQTYIAQARRLDASNADVLLEAGLIAILTGDEQTARSDWNEVLALPDAEAQSQIAQSYLTQLETP